MTAHTLDDRATALRDLGRRLGRDAAADVDTRDWRATWSADLFRGFGPVGALTPLLPQAFGGLGAGVVGTVALLDGFGEGSGDPGLALALATHGVLAASAIHRLGDERLRERHLRALAAGHRLVGIGVAEASGGVDGQRTEVVARAAGDGWALHGARTDVVLGAVADHVLVTAVDQYGAATAFLVDRDAPGVSVEPDPDPIGLRTAALATVQFDGCRLPAQALVGIPGRAAQELVPLLAALDRVALPAGWLGLLRELTRRSRALVDERTLFGAPLARSQTVRARMVEVSTRIELGAGLLHRAARGLDAGTPAPREHAAVARLFLGAALRDTAAEAGALAGLTPDPLVWRVHRDALLLTATGGGDEVLQAVVANAVLRSAPPASALTPVP